MAKLPTLTGKEVARIVEQFGFVYDHTTVATWCINTKTAGRQPSLIMLEKK